jgi:hypothetical protein
MSGKVSPSGVVGRLAAEDVCFFAETEHRTRIDEERQSGNHIQLEEVRQQGQDVSELAECIVEEAEA